MKQHKYRADKKPEEYPKPERPAEIPGKPSPDAPLLPPDKPEIIPPEKPEENPPSEMPDVDDFSSLKLSI